jgi:SAM-dependent methyltransferase
MKLDVGCGQKTKEGYVGMDISPDVGAEYVWSWEEYPWPFADESVEEINACHVLEHTKDLMKFMNECHRILKKGGKMHVECPYHTSTGAWQDPTHTRAISEMTFVYFNRRTREQWKLDHYPITADFEFSYIHVLGPEWINKPDQQRSFAIEHYFNVCRTILVELTKN